MKYYGFIITALLCFLICRQDGNAQVSRDTSRNFQRVQAQFQKGSRKPVEVTLLAGDVVIDQDSTLFYADTALITENRYLSAVGNIIIQPSDTTAAFGDSLEYDTDVGIAELMGDVVLQSGVQRLFTTYLLYNLELDYATYSTGAVLTDGDYFLSSKRGVYATKSNVIIFRDSVVVAGPDFSLKSDSIRYDATINKVYFLGPTRINQQGTAIYCEDGFFNLETNDALFVKNAQYKGEERLAAADSIYYFSDSETFELIGKAYFEEDDQRARARRMKYNETTGAMVLDGNAYFESSTQRAQGDYIEYNSKTEDLVARGRTRIEEGAQIIEADSIDRSGLDSVSILKGKVAIRDTAAQLSVFSEEAVNDEGNDILKAYGDSTWLIVGVDKDSLYMRADTLYSGKDTSGYKQINGYYKVRIFKSNMQAVCDSVYYSERDSMFWLFGSPFVWSDTSQFSADIIRLQMANDKIDRIFMDGKAFIINTIDERFFNQIKGRQITVFLEDQQLDRLLVEGNAQSVYYILDEQDRYIGVNAQESSHFTMYFHEGEVSDIRFYEKPTGKSFPMEEADHEGLKLDGFLWNTEVRPMRIADIFVVL